MTDIITEVRIHIAAPYFYRYDTKILTGWCNELSYRTSVHPCPACRHVPTRRTRQGSNCVHNMRLPEERVQVGKEHINLDNLCTSTWMPRHCQATGNFIPRYMDMRRIHTMHSGVLLARQQTRHVLLLLPHTD